ncbi:hypothetical protein IL306_012763 [Fusarium sp. DS 682]|nr:hypothetical protein IL306_012763 [Fusarium sp. DS 682]
MAEAVYGMDQRAVIDQLQTATGASYDSFAEENNPVCLPNTRVALLHKIQKWTQELVAQPIFWLDGKAGTGKSTISRTLARELSRHHKLGANFFFKRSESDRRSLQKLFTTMASQLATKNAILATHIKNAIDADGNITNKGLQEQFEKLILEPLSKVNHNLGTPNPLILVIDALDECEAESSQVESILRKLCQGKALGLKVFITSRPEHHIQLGFCTIDGDYLREILHETSEAIIDSDLSLLFQHELFKTRSNYNRTCSIDDKLPQDWPGKSTISCLVEMASPLFIFAATLCRFIGDWRCGGPDQQLQKVLQYRSMSEESQLNMTYLPVLDNLLATKRQRKDYLNCSI